MGQNVITKGLYQKSGRGRLWLVQAQTTEIAPTGECQVTLQRICDKGRHSSDGSRRASLGDGSNECLGYQWRWIVAGTCIRLVDDELKEDEDSDEGHIEHFVR